MRLLKRNWMINCLLVAGLALCACSESEEAKLETLADSFKQANQAESIEPMLALYCLDGVDKRTLTRLKGALEFELGIPILNIQFEPLTGAPEESIQFVHDEITYGPSLPPGYRMRVTYDQEDGLTSLYTVGCGENGNWQIVCARPIEASEEALSYTPALR